jgi:hypothetical protein
MLTKSFRDGLCDKTLFVSVAVFLILVGLGSFGDSREGEL